MPVINVVWAICLGSVPFVIRARTIGQRYYGIANAESLCCVVLAVLSCHRPGNYATRMADPTDRAGYFSAAL